MSNEPLWFNTVDRGKFTAKVIQNNNDAYAGELIVLLTDTEPEVELMRQDVGIGYGGQYGPDYSDIQLWELAAIEVINKWYLDNNEEPPKEAP